MKNMAPSEVFAAFCAGVVSLLLGAFAIGIYAGSIALGLGIVFLGMATVLVSMVLFGAIEDAIGKAALMKKG